MYAKLRDLEEAPNLRKIVVTTQVDEYLKKCLIYFAENYYNHGNYGVLADEDYKIQENTLYLWDGKIFALGQKDNLIFCHHIIDEKYFYKISYLLNKYTNSSRKFTKNYLLNILRVNRLKFDDDAMCEKIAVIHILKEFYDMSFNRHLFLNSIQAAKWKNISFEELIKVEEVINFGLED